MGSRLAAHVDGRWTMSEWLSGTIVLTLSANGPMFRPSDLDAPAEQLRYLAEMTSPLVAALSYQSNWRVESSEMPDWALDRRLPTTDFRQPARSILACTPNLDDPTSLGERAAAAEVLADVLSSDPALRIPTVSLLDWVILPESRRLRGGEEEPLGSAERTAYATTLRDLRAPFIGPFIDGLRYVRDLTTFRDFHTVLDPQEASIVHELVKVYNGRVALYPQARPDDRTVLQTALRLTADDWCSVQDPTSRTPSVHEVGRSRKLSVEDVLSY